VSRQPNKRTFPVDVLDARDIERVGNAGTLQMRWIPAGSTGALRMKWLRIGCVLAVLGAVIVLIA